MKFVKKSFLNYLLSYLIIMIISLFTFSFIFYGYFLNFFTNNLKHSNLNALLRVQSNIDIQIAQIQSYAYRMSNSQEFTSQYLTASYAQFYDVFNSLSNIKYSNDFIYEILYLNNDLHYIYTTDTRFSIDDFKDYSSSYDAYNLSQFKELMQDIKTAEWLPIQSVQDNSAKVLTYIIPIQKAQNIANTAAIFQIKKETVDRLVGNVISKDDSCIMIADEANRTIYTSSEEFNILPDNFWQSLANIKSYEPLTIELNKKTFIVYCEASATTNFKYISLIPYENIIASLQNLKTIFLAGIIISTFLGLVSIFFSMRKNYSPLISLGNLARSHLTNEQSHLNEIEATRQAIINISDNNKMIMAENFQLLREDLLFRLLCGSFSDVEAFTAEARRVNIIFDGPLYRVLVFKFNANESECLVSFDLVAEYIENTIGCHIELFIIEYIEDNSIILLLSGSEEKMENTINMLNALQKDITTEYRLNGMIGVSRTYNLILKTYVAFMEAKTALTNIPAGGQSCVILPDNLYGNNKLEYGYPSDSISALYNAIMLGDPNRIKFAVDILIKYLENTGSLFFASCIGYDIVNTILRAMRKLNIPLSSLNQNHPEIMLKSEIHLPYEIIDIIRKITHDICQSSTDQCPQARLPNNTCNDISAVLSFIDSHFTEELFSVKALADHFNMSVSNLSHFFKIHTGRVVSEYINHLRFENAKMLLRTTNLTIAEIVTQSGYYHISTFMRQFKQIENMTPTFYRNMCHSIMQEDETSSD